MLTPNGQSADNIDKIMLLGMWTKQLAQDQTSREIISAGMGKPTYPINLHTVISYKEYWDAIYQTLVNTESSLKHGKAINYGDPNGNSSALKQMSIAMTKWYNVEVLPDNILFTVGGAGALRVIFEAFNKKYKNIPHYRVITPFPHYTLYSDNRHLLHPVEVMNVPGYRLTEKSLRLSIEKAKELAKSDGNEPKVFLLSNPSNPLGTIINQDELRGIASVLREYPELNIVIDEAYAEMSWISTRIPSILELAPDLKERVTILRSATKAHSAAGERMAMLINFNDTLMNKFKGVNISTIGHAPISSQRAYAYAMYNFCDLEQNKLQRYYEEKTRFVSSKISEMCASMPDAKYKIDGTFYVMADLSDLFGMNIPTDAKKALGHGGVIQSSEDLVYSLLFDHFIMIAPGQYFGLPSKKGFCRITCSGSSDELDNLMNCLQELLFKERLKKNRILSKKVEINLSVLKSTLLKEHNKLSKKFHELYLPQTNKDVVCCNAKLSELLSLINVAIMKNSIDGEDRAAIKIQSFFKKHYEGSVKNFKKNREEREWQDFARNYATDGGLLNYLLNLSHAERLTFVPWKEKKLCEMTGTEASIS